MCYVCFVAARGDFKLPACSWIAVSKVTPAIVPTCSNSLESIDISCAAQGLLSMLSECNLKVFRYSLALLTSSAAKAGAAIADLSWPASTRQRRVRNTSPLISGKCQWS